MKRIGLFLGVEPHAGGMFQYAQSLMDALRRAPVDRYQVQLAYAGDAWAEVLKDYPFPAMRLKGGALALRIAQAIMALRLPGGFTRAINRLNPVYWQLRAFGCDAWIFPAQDAIAYQLPLPFITTIHDLMHRYEPEFPEVSDKARFAIREHRFQSLVEAAKGILTDSEVGKAHVIEAYGAKPERVHPLPYLPPRGVLEAKDDPTFEERYRLPAKFLFYPAQFWAHKNHMRLISAAFALRASCPDIHLVFTGGKRYEYEAVRAHAERLGMSTHITFAGYVPDADIPGFYKRARALVFPTFFGPTNIPPLEAFACGCPVAISGIYAMPEQLGEAALYFNPRSEEEITRAMQRLWQDDALCETLIVRGKEKLANWGQVQFSERLQHILAEILTPS